jgi:hypothetical protein
MSESREEEPFPIEDHADGQLALVARVHQRRPD